MLVERVTAGAAPPSMYGTHREAIMQISVIMKFGGSSLASAERIREVAEIICSFPEHYPCIVLSAMGKVSVCVAPSQTLSTT